MNPFQAAEQLLVDQIQRHGADVVLVNDTGTRIPLKASIGQSETEQSAPGSASLPLTIVRTTDFLIATADLNTYEITRGCRIEFNGQRYQPASPNGQPLCRDSGRFGLVTRIHAVSVH